jgi:hypothetical protein
VSEAAVLLGALLSPLLAFALLMWLTHLEETLPHDVAAARREPPPPPILVIFEAVPAPGPAMPAVPASQATVAGTVTGSAPALGSPAPAPDLPGGWIGSGRLTT